MATTADLVAAIDTLEASVTAETTVEDSAKALLAQLNQLYTDALNSAGTPQEVLDRVTALNTAIQARTQALSDAVTANTPTV